MSEKTDFLNYINPQPKGGRFTVQWQQEPMSGGDFYIEDKSGKVFDVLLRSIRPGTVVRVRRVFCLAPWRATPRKRRAAIAARVAEVEARNGLVLETETGLRSDDNLAEMLMRAYEDVATSGRGQAKRERPGRPAKEWTAHELGVMETVWQSRRYKNDDERLTAIKKRIGKTPGRTALRIKFGSPHKMGGKD